MKIQWGDDLVHLSMCYNVSKHAGISSLFMDTFGMKVLFF